MKKAVQYSDKFGQVLAADKKPTKRAAPGVMLEAAKPAKKFEEKKAPKVEKKTSKPEATSDDK